MRMSSQKQATGLDSGAGMGYTRPTSEQWTATARESRPWSAADWPNASTP
jgi:hypothetical protein